jgi:hypothetical protein
MKNNNIHMLDNLQKIGKTKEYKKPCFDISKMDLPKISKPKKDFLLAKRGYAWSD